MRSTGVKSGLVSCGLLTVSCGAFAQGVIVDRVYDPYVEEGVTMLEWRATRQRDAGDEELDGEHLHRFGVGHGFSERWLGAVYVIGEGNDEDRFDLVSAELEAKWQISEEREGSATWGMLFELEREYNANSWEAAATVIGARNWGQWTGIANLAAIYKWGDEGKEFEPEIHLQGRYRWKESLQPALELYTGDDTVGLGPVLLGEVETAPEQRFRWEFGVIFGLTDDSPHQSFRILLEYEFF